MRNMGNHGTRTLLALGMAAAVSAVQARGDDVWRGSTNAYSTVAWTDGAYWSQGTAPTNGGMARISAQKTSEINIDAASVSLDGLVLNGIATRFTGNAVTLSAGAPVYARTGFTTSTIRSRCWALPGLMSRVEAIRRRPGISSNSGEGSRLRRAAF